MTQLPLKCQIGIFLLVCTILWRESYPITGPQGFTQEIQVQVCPWATSFHVEILGRIMLGEYEASGWKTLHFQRFELTSHGDLEPAPGVYP